MAVVLDLPWPPSLNAMWRHVVIPSRGGKGRSCTLLSKQGREYRERVVKQYAGGESLTGRLKVTLELYPPTRRRTDVDNYAKGILDALTHAGVWGDDSQVDDLRIIRRDVLRGGRCTVTIETMEVEQ